MAYVKKREYIPEFEAPNKKINTEKDDLVKELAQKQLNTNISLQSALSDEKRFEKSTETVTSIQDELINLNRSECCKLNKEESKTVQNAPLEHPMNRIKELEKEIITQAFDKTDVDVRKIRRKARKLQNRINRKTAQRTNTLDNKQLINKTSKWDVIEMSNSMTVANQVSYTCQKSYGCQNRNFYTIKDGKIVKIDDNNKS